MSASSGALDYIVRVGVCIQYSAGIAIMDDIRGSFVRDVVCFFECGQFLFSSCEVSLGSCCVLPGRHMI